MRNIKRLSVVLAMILTILAVAMCGYAEEEIDRSEIVVGIAQIQYTSEWRIAETNSMIRALNDAGYQVIYTNAQGDTQQQMPYPCPPPSGSGPRWTSSPPGRPPCNRNIEKPSGRNGSTTPSARMWRPCWKSRGRPNRRGSGATNWNSVDCALCRTFQRPLGAV